MWGDKGEKFQRMHSLPEEGEGRELIWSRPWNEGMQVPNKAATFAYKFQNRSLIGTTHLFLLFV